MTTTKIRVAVPASGDIKSGLFRVLAAILLAGAAGAPVRAQFLEQFTYDNGDIAGNTNPGSATIWVGTGATAASVVVDTNQLKLQSADPGSTVTSFATLSFPDVVAGQDSVIITVRAKIQGTSPNNGNIWKLFFYNVQGANRVLMAEWDGTYATARPRHEGANSCAGSCPGTNQLGTQNGAQSTLTGGGLYDEISADINVITGEVNYYFTPNGGSRTYVNTMKDTRIVEGITGSVNQVEFQRQNRNDATHTGNILFDDIEVFSPPTNCASALTPAPFVFITDNFLSVAEPSGAGFPPSFTFTLTDRSTSPINFTAVESRADGSPIDYPWLSVAPASGGPLSAAGGSTSIVASVTPGAAPGIYAGSIKVADDCSPSGAHIRPIVLTVGSAPCFVDPFQYPNGNLGANGGWSGGEGFVLTAVDPDNADNQVVRVNLGATASSATMTGLNCPPCEDGTFIAIARIKGSPSGAPAANPWMIDFNDSAGNNLARWEGDYNRARGRTAGNATLLTPYGNFDHTSFHELKVLIDVKNNRNTYYLNNVPLGTAQQTHGADLVNGRSNVGDRINAIAITRSNSAAASGYVLIDDVQIISCPGDCLGRVSPDLSQNDFTALAHAKSGATTATLNDDVTVYGTDYTFHNEGPASISYTVQEVNASGAPTDHAWMALSKSGAGPLTGGTSDTPVTITYDTTGLADGLYRGYIKFTDDCNPDRTYTRAVQLNVGQCIADDFAYPDGNLESMPGWRTGFLNQLATVPQRPGGTSPFPIEVVGGKVVVRGKPAPGTVEATHQRFDHCSVCPDLDTETPGLQGDGLVVVRARIKGTVGGGGSRFWNLEFTNNTGQILASWRGAATFAEGHSNATLTSSLTDGLYHDLRAVVNPNDIEVEGIPANTTKYFFDGALMGSGLASHASPAADRIVLIRIRRDNNANADADPTIEIDDIHVSDCGPICGDPVFDVRGATPVDLVRDGRVTDKDLAIFQACGDFPAPAVPNPSLSKECKCMDLDNNDIIDLRDYARFQRCYSGASAADPACDN